MPGPSPHPDAAAHSAETLRRAVRLLQFLLESPHESFVHGSALDLLLTEFSNRLEREIVRGRSDQLLESWEQRLAPVRQHLLREMSRQPLRFADGKQAPVMTPDAVRQLIGLCPDVTGEEDS